MATKTSNVINLASLSDIHLGHPKTSTASILGYLRWLFRRCKETSELDVIFIPGDVFDRRLELPDEIVYDIRRFIVELLTTCKEYNIILRVLEGTPSHDWKQSKLFTHLNDVCNIHADVKHIDVLSIEYIEPLDCQVLYIPDEWKATCDETWLDVVDKLDQHRLQKVDFVIMHGAFPHQMPENLHERLQLHNPDNYLSICNYFIIVGHIHFYSQYERILSSGSTSRLRHNEEEPKGTFRIKVDRLNHNHQIRFIVNDAARIYKTVDCTDMDEHSVNEVLNRVLSTLPDDSALRIKCRRSDIAVAMLPKFTQANSNIEWSLKEVGKNELEKRSAIESLQVHHKGININPSNIEELLLKRIAVKDPSLYEHCRSLLTEVINE